MTAKKIKKSSFIPIQKTVVIEEKPVFEIDEEEEKQEKVRPKSVVNDKFAQILMAKKDR